MSYSKLNLERNLKSKIDNVCRESQQLIEHKLNEISNETQLLTPSAISSVIMEVLPNLLFQIIDANNNNLIKHAESRAKERK